jgi:NADPH2:quinone reductase
VRVEASGVNFIDVYFRTGLYKPAALPFVAGQEGAGLVEAVGDGAIGVSPGNRVAWTNVPGAYAERAAVPADKLVALPEGLGAREGAAAMLQGTTAHYLATSTYPLKPGDTCVVHAAAGGVGLLLCQVAKRRGAHVIGVVGSADKAALASEAGADHVVVGREAEFEAEARRLTGGRGVQVVYDGVGRATFDASLRSLAPRGMMVLFGQASGPVPPVDPAVLASRGSLFLTRPSLYHYLATREELVARASEVFAWVRDGLLKLRVGAEYPLRDAAAAHRALEGRATTGKVLLIP